MRIRDSSRPEDGIRDSVASCGLGDVYKRQAFDRSPMFNGNIESIGPRYCPSIEDKINRFSEKSGHQIFVEPEGWNTIEVYVNGFSTSLPEEIQFKALRSIVGFENVKLFRPGYAIEYDFFQPTQLYNTLETKLITGLYFAGPVSYTHLTLPTKRIV